MLTNEGRSRVDDVTHVTGGKFEFARPTMYTFWNFDSRTFDNSDIYIVSHMRCKYKQWVSIPTSYQGSSHDVVIDGLPTHIKDNKIVLFWGTL